jgi:hypothetical protein
MGTTARFTFTYSFFQIFCSFHKYLTNYASKEETMSYFKDNPNMSTYFRKKEKYMKGKSHKLSLSMPGTFTLPEKKMVSIE